MSAKMIYLPATSPLPFRIKNSLNPHRSIPEFGEFLKKQHLSWATSVKDLLVTDGKG